MIARVPKLQRPLTLTEWADLTADAYDQTFREGLDHFVGQTFRWRERRITVRIGFDRGTGTAVPVVTEHVVREPMDGLPQSPEQEAAARDYERYWRCRNRRHRRYAILRRHLECLVVHRIYGPDPYSFWHEGVPDTPRRRIIQVGRHLATMTYDVTHGGHEFLWSWEHGPIHLR